MEQPFKVAVESSPGVGMASLSDGLTDVYGDLKRGSLLWESGHEEEAGFEWRLSFRTHWGVRAFSASGR